MEYTVTYVEQLVAKYKALGDKLIGEITPQIKITHSHRKSTVGGYAYYNEWRILLNVPLLQYHPEEIETTVGHEVAHLFANKIDLYCKHGQVWKNVMRAFGLEPRRCHDMKAAVLVGKTKSFTYQYTMQCKDCGKVLHYHAHHEIKDFNNTGISHPRCEQRERYHKGSMVVISVVTRDQFIADLLQVKGEHQSKVACSAAPDSTTEALSKKERAEIIYKQNQHLGRKAVIEMFINQLNMTPAGSATYYANCKKKFG